MTELVLLQDITETLQHIRMGVAVIVLQLSAISLLLVTRGGNDD